MMGRQNNTPSEWQEGGGGHVLGCRTGAACSAEICMGAVTRMDAEVKLNRPAAPSYRLIDMQRQRETR